MRAAPGILYLETSYISQVRYLSQTEEQSAADVVVFYNFNNQKGLEGTQYPQNSCCLLHTAWA